MMTDAQAGRAHQPAGALATWMAAMGWEGGPVAPAEASTWAALWRQEQAQGSWTESEEV